MRSLTDFLDGIGVNFALILFVLLVITGVLWSLDYFKFRKLRAADAKEPVWVEWGAGFFPVILFVFILRSFIVEPFQIPSGSMIPTLQIGDFILVNKYTYGIRLPVIDKKVVDINLPQRGEVMVFRYPANPSVNYIKRVVGLPGDKIEYKNKRLTINGEKLEAKQLEDYRQRISYSQQYLEKLGDVEHRILNDKEAPAYISDDERFPYRENCNYNQAGVTCTVPAGHYFMVGDNRDNSRDSRYWGFVPEENIVGKAYFIWFNWENLSRGDLSRIGGFN